MSLLTSALKIGVFFWKIPISFFFKLAIYNAFFLALQAREHFDNADGTV